MVTDTTYLPGRKLAGIFDPACTHRLPSLLPHHISSPPSPLTLHLHLPALCIGIYKQQRHGLHPGLKENMPCISICLAQA